MKQQSQQTDLEHYFDYDYPQQLKGENVSYIFPLLSKLIFQRQCLQKKTFISIFTVTIEKGKEEEAKEWKKIEEHERLKGITTRKSYEHRPYESNVNLREAKLN